MPCRTQQQRAAEAGDRGEWLPIAHRITAAEFEAFRVDSRNVFAGAGINLQHVTDINEQGHTLDRRSVESVAGLVPPLAVSPSIPDRFP